MRKEDIKLAVDVFGRGKKFISGIGRGKIE